MRHWLDFSVHFTCRISSPRFGLDFWFFNNCATFIIELNFYIGRTLVSWVIFKLQKDKGIEIKPWSNQHLMVGQNGLNFQAGSCPNGAGAELRVAKRFRLARDCAARNEIWPNLNEAHLQFSSQCGKMLCQRNRRIIIVYPAISWRSALTQVKDISEDWYSTREHLACVIL